MGGGPSERADSRRAVAIGEDLREAHRLLVAHLHAPGAWWSGRERLLIAREARRAADCNLCADRKSALSPGAVSGEHDAGGELPPEIVDVIHRVRTDPARLSKAWFEQVTAGALTVPQYVELIGVVTLLTGLDYFARSIGHPPYVLSAPLAGQPSRHLPTSAKAGTAWVPMIAPEDASGPESDLYGSDPFVPNIVRALSLVPDEVRALRRSSEVHYLPVGQIGDPSARRTLDRMQMELVAARVSALNQCFY